MTCAKNMQTAGKVQIVQLPRLQNVKLCPVQALQTMLTSRKDRSKDSPYSKFKLGKVWFL